MKSKRKYRAQPRVAGRQTVSASEAPATTGAEPYNGLPWRIVIMIGDSNMGGVSSGYGELDRATHPYLANNKVWMYDRAGHGELETFHGDNAPYGIRPMNVGYGGENEAPWIYGGDGIGPEYGMAAELEDVNDINTLVVKLGLGGSYAFLGAGWNWNAAMTGANAALERVYNEHYLPAVAALTNLLHGATANILQTSVVSLIGGNDMFTARSPSYLANMGALIAHLRGLIDSKAPTNVPWALVKQPLYESPLGTPFEDIVSIRNDQETLNDPVNKIYRINVGQPTPGAGELHWDAAGQYAAGKVIGSWLKFVAP